MWKNAKISYRSLLSVACLLLSVELSARSVHAANPASPAVTAEDQREPDPGPQAQIYQNSNYYEAKQLLSQHKWTEAAVVLRSVLRGTPDFFPAAVGLANALAYQGRREEALSTLSQVIEKQHSKTRAILIARSRVLAKIFLTQESFQAYQDGYVLLVAGKLRPAREKFEKVLAREPDNVLVLTRLGQCLILENDYDSATERLKTAKRLDAYEPEISLWLGRALHQRGEIVSALEELRLAEKSLSALPQSSIWLADALASQGNRGPAIQLLEDDIKAQPGHIQSLVSLARLRMQPSQPGQQNQSNSKNLLLASKDLRIALSRVSETPPLVLAIQPTPANIADDELDLDITPPAGQLKDEIRVLIQQVDARLADTSHAGET